MPRVGLRSAIRGHAKRHQDHDARRIARQNVLPWLLPPRSQIHLADLTARRPRVAGPGDEETILDPADRYLAPGHSLQVASGRAIHGIKPDGRSRPARGKRRTFWRDSPRGDALRR